MKKRRVILSFISLMVSLVFVVLSTFAWFTINENAKTDGMEMEVITDTIKNATLNKYIAIESDGKYTNGADISDESVEIAPYDLIYPHDKIIYQFDFNVLEDININIYMELNDMDRTNILTQAGDKYYNYLSNVMVIYFINDDNTLSSTKYEFVYNDNQISQIKILSNYSATKGTETVRFLVDYNGENVNQLFTDNIGVDADIMFKNDVGFYITEAK